MDEAAVERVLLAADLVPAGRVVTYGDLARLAGVGPRQVGAIMSRHGSEVSWWRVVNASGRLPADLAPVALRHWAAEGIPHVGDRVRLRDARADIAAAYWAAVH